MCVVPISINDTFNLFKTHGMRQDFLYKYLAEHIDKTSTVTFDEFLGFLDKPDTERKNMIGHFRKEQHRTRIVRQNNCILNNFKFVSL